MSFFDDLRQYYSDQPHEVSIETQALCNARCTFCPYPNLERKGTKMPDELLDRLLEEFKSFKLPFYFSPFKVNEPFLDKRLIPLCEKFNATVPQGYLRLFTNGSALTDKHIEGVAKLERVVHLWISLNECDAVKYEQVMGLDFDHTAKCLDRLHEYVTAGTFTHPVVVSRVGGKLEEINQFIGYVSKRWPKFAATVIRKDAWIDFTTPDVTEVPEHPCGRWWELNITATGKTALCCMDSTSEYGFGDLNKTTMKELYNSPGMKALRANYNRKKSGEPCNRCSYG